MTEKTATSQLELFSRDRDNPAQAKPLGFKGLLFGYVRGYEKTILLIISFLGVGIISFSLGVEKGRKLALNQTPGMRAYQRQTTVVSAQKPALPTQIPPPAEKQNILQNYTIQVASYQTKDLAWKEAGLLKKKGLSALVLAKGKYTILCIGNFSSQNAAKSFLSEIEKQKRYKGSFIRRL